MSVTVTLLSVMDAQEEKEAFPDATGFTVGNPTDTLTIYRLDPPADADRCAHHHDPFAPPQLGVPVAAYRAGTWKRVQIDPQDAAPPPFEGDDPA